VPSDGRSEGLAGRKPESCLGPTDEEEETKGVGSTSEEAVDVCGNAGAASGEQGNKLLGLLLAGSTGQHMAGRNGLA
jgi:hypothetical protein